MHPWWLCSLFLWDVAKAAGQIGASPEGCANEAERDQGTQRHEDGREQRAHVPGQGERHRADVVCQREREYTAHSSLPHLCDVEQGGHEAQAVAKEVEVRLVLEKV